MVKVSFNSALAQKDSAKKEEEEERGQNEKNSCSNQVLILSPDTKVRRMLLPSASRASSRNESGSPGRGVAAHFASCGLKAQSGSATPSLEGERMNVRGEQDGVKTRSYIGPNETPEVVLSRLGL